MRPRIFIPAQEGVKLRQPIQEAAAMQGVVRGHFRGHDGGGHGVLVPDGGAEGIADGLLKGEDDRLFPVLIVFHPLRQELEAGEGVLHPRAVVLRHGPGHLGGDDALEGHGISGQGPLLQGDLLHPDGAVKRKKQAYQDPQQGGLARSVGPDNADGVLFPGRKGHSVQDLTVLLICKCQIFYFDMDMAHGLLPQTENIMRKSSPGDYPAKRLPTRTRTGKMRRKRIPPAKLTK